MIAVATKALIVRDGAILRIWKSDAEAALSIAPDERWDLPGGRLLPGESPTERSWRKPRWRSRW